MLCSSVNAFGRYVHGGVEAKGDISTHEVIVYRLGDADDRDAIPEQLVR